LEDLMEGEIETVGAIGLAALPGIVAGLIAVVRPLIEKRLTSDVLPPLAVVAGVGAAFLAEAGGALDYGNPAALVLVGINIGLAAVGLNSIQSHYRSSGGP
jgi:hypothetical protein